MEQDLHADETAVPIEGNESARQIISLAGTQETHLSRSLFRSFVFHSLLIL
jgi:hypothetical protein